MKRHSSLQPLSREHHPALVQAKRLCDFTGDGAQAREVGNAFVEFWDAAITPHFREEEEWLLPLLALRGGDETEEIRETLRQHVQLRRQVLELRQRLNSDTPVVAPFLNGLGEALRSHVRFEEEELFPCVEAALSEADLAYLSELLDG